MDDRTPSVADELPALSPEFRARFDFIGILGRGGMGVVYRVRDRALDREVALKLIEHPDPETRARFLREGRMLARLSHPGILEVFDLGEESGLPYILMELVDGESLRQRLEARRGLVWPQTRPIFQQILAALAHAHESEILHRDLKPENLLITGATSVRIADFGLARDVEGAEALTGPGIVMGTPSYMAPELFRGEPSSVASDVYALGCILWEMLTGTVLVPAVGPDGKPRSIVEVYDAHERGGIPPGRVPAVLEAVLGRCLAKSPGDRFGSVAELAAAFGTLPPTLEGSTGASTVRSNQPVRRRTRPLPTEPVPGSPAGPSTPGTAIAPGGRWRRPRSLAIALGAVIAGVLLVAVGPGSRPDPLPASSAAPDVTSSAIPGGRGDPALPVEALLAGLSPHLPWPAPPPLARAMASLPGAGIRELQDRLSQTSSAAGWLSVPGSGVGAILAVLLSRGADEARTACEYVGRVLDAPPLAREDELLTLVASYIQPDLELFRRALERQAGHARHLGPVRARILAIRALGIRGALDPLAGDEARRQAWQAARASPDRMEPWGLLLDLGEPLDRDVIGTVRCETDGSPMVFIPPSVFTMGRTKGPGHPNQLPAHRVRLGGYFMDVYPVTVVRFRTFHDWIKRTRDHGRCDPDSGCRTPGKEDRPHFDSAIFETTDPDLRFSLESSDRTRRDAVEGRVSTLDPRRDSYPMTGVTWYDAVAYAHWAGRQLPSEAQFELAARGLDGRTYPWGDQPPDSTRASYAPGGDEERSTLVPTGRFDHVPSPWGVQELAGGVWEWCQDWFDDSGYGQALPDPVVDPVGPPGGTERVQRGGAWYRSEDALTTYNRDADVPEYTKFRKFGFRTVRPRRPLPAIPADPAPPGSAQVPEGESVTP